MTLDVPLAVRLEEWRKKAAEGTMSTEEMREAILAIRAGRVSAQKTSSASKIRKGPVDVKALDDEIDAL